MKQLLRQRLMEYGWRDQMKSYCKGSPFTRLIIVREIPSSSRNRQTKRSGEHHSRWISSRNHTQRTGSVNRSSLHSPGNDLILVLALVPDSIKKEMLARLRQYLSKHEELWSFIPLSFSCKVFVPPMNWAHLERIKLGSLSKESNICAFFQIRWLRIRETNQMCSALNWLPLVDLAVVHTDSVRFFEKDLP